ncbi:MAG: helix-turn-helix domain-containing protein [Cyanobium sp.]
MPSASGWAAHRASGSASSGWSRPWPSWSRGGSSIRAVALACGYRHMGLFSSDFRKHFGLTPSAVRWQGGKLVQAYAGAGNRGHPSPSPATRSRSRNRQKPPAGAGGRGFS